MNGAAPLGVVMACSSVGPEGRHDHATRGSGIHLVDQEEEPDQDEVQMPAI